MLYVLEDLVITPTRKVEIASMISGRRNNERPGAGSWDITQGFSVHPQCPIAELCGLKNAFNFKDFSPKLI